MKRHAHDQGVQVNHRYARKENNMAVEALGAGTGLEPYPPVAPVAKPTVQAPDVTTQQAREARVSSTPATPDQETLTKELAFANSVTKLFDAKVLFSYDDRINQVVVKIIDNGTQQVIRQFPPEEMIKLHLQLKENFQGIIRPVS